MAVQLKYLSNLWRTLKIPLISCEIRLFVTWKVDCAISAVTGATTFAITEIKLYAPMVTLSTKDNAKLL